MSKFISAVVGAGFALAAAGAYANGSADPDDADWVQPQVTQDNSHQSKSKPGPDQTAKPGRTARPSPGDVTMQPTQPGAATGQSGGSTTGDQHARDSQSGQSGQTAPSGKPDQSGQNEQKRIPNQSMPSVGHPADGAATGQFGEKKFDQRTGQSGSNQPPTN